MDLAKEYILKNESRIREAVIHDEMSPLIRTVTEWAYGNNDTNDIGKLYSLMEELGDNNVLAALARAFKDNPEIVARKVQGFGKENARKSIRTIGVYIKRSGKDGVAKVNSLVVPVYLKLGYSVVIFTGEMDPKDRLNFPKEVEWVVLPYENDINNPAFFAESVFALDDAIKKYNIDFMIHNSAISPRLLWDIMVCKNNGVKVCLYVHELFSQQLAKCDSFVFSRAIVYKLLDKVCVLSKFEAYYWKVWGIPTICIQNPVEVRERKENTGDYILWVGRYDSIQKRFMDAIEIMKKVCERIPAAKLMMCGADLNEGRKKNIDRKIKKYGLEENIIISGYIENMDIVYKNARLILVTSLFESFPMAMSESKAYGIPMVTYDMPYLEILQDYHDSFIAVAQKSINQAAEAVISILKDDKLAMKMSDSAYESIQMYQKTDISEMWRDIIEEQHVREPFGDLSSDEYKHIIEILLFHYQEGSLLYQKELKRRKKLEKNVLYKMALKQMWIKDIINDYIHKG